jgi:heterodisulfide reductase subunit C
MGLLLFHALGQYFSMPLDPYFNPTVNPWLFLRNFFGVMAIVGVCVAIWRRATSKMMRKTGNTMDAYTIIILAVIMLSGFGLEAVKITSEAVYENMVLDFVGGFEDEEEAMPLKAYWADSYGVVFKDFEMPEDPAVLEEGYTMHRDYCADCHAKPQAAFFSYGLAKTITPVAVGLNEVRADLILWYVHLLACFVGLAYLPFSKFFHVLTAPLGMLSGAVVKKSEPAPAALANHRSMELDACTHCAVCSEHCSVASALTRFDNNNILPSEKLASAKGLVNGSELTDNTLRLLRQGSDICTGCYRCTELCPSGINLQDLWAAFKEELAQKGYPDTYVSASRAMTKKDSAQEGKAAMEVVSQKAGNPASGYNLPEARYCFECQTCTNSCPVVRMYDDPKGVLGMLPHQIIHTLKLSSALGLELQEMAVSTRMVWDCTTCYNCQEHCPQGVPIADILYEIRNQAFAELNKKTA